MGIKTTRQKPRNLWISVIYRLQKLLPISNKTKLRIFLNLEWLFDRLVLESAHIYYSEHNNPSRAFSKLFIMKHILPEYKVLDLGCNTGIISNYIAEIATLVTGIDYNKNAIEAAQKNYSKSNLQFYTAEARDFLSKSETKYDVLILSHILEHLDNPSQFLLDYKNYFSFIYVEVPDFDRSYLNHYRQDLKMNLIYTDDDHVSEFDRVELHELLTNCGISVIEAEYRYGVQKLWCKVL